VLYRLASARFIDAKELLNNTLSKLIMQSNNAVIVEFTMVLLRQVMVKDEQVPVSQLADVLTALHHIYTSGDRRPAVLNSLMAELVQLLSDAEERFKRQNGVPQAGAETKAVEEPPLEVYTYALSEQLQRVDQVPWEDAPEPPGMAATVLQSLDDWVAVCTSEYAVSEKHFSAFVASLYSRNLMSDDNMKAYFRLLNTAAIDKSNASFKRNPEDLKTAFQEIDAVTRLIGYMVRFDNLNARTNLAKVQLLNGYLFAAWQVSAFVLYCISVRCACIDLVLPVVCIWLHIFRRSTGITVCAVRTSISALGCVCCQVCCTSSTRQTPTSTRTIPVCCLHWAHASTRCVRPACRRSRSHGSS